MSDDLVEYARKVLEGVAEGPWYHFPCPCGDKVCSQRTISVQGSVGFDRADAHFIAASRQLMPEMANRLGVLEAAHREIVRQFGDTPGGHVAAIISLKALTRNRND